MIDLESCRTGTVVLDCHKFDEMISEYYGVPYATQRTSWDGGYSQDTLVHIGDIWHHDEIKARAAEEGPYSYDPAEDYIDPLNAWLEAGKSGLKEWEISDLSPRPEVILSDLYTKGFVDKGFAKTCAIYVSW